MSHPSIRTTQLMRYLNAGRNQLGPVIQSLQGAQEYDPGKDYWRRMRQAIQKDRRTTRDGAAVRAAAFNASKSRMANFERVAEDWPSIASRWVQHRPAHLEPATVTIAGTPVVVRPTFVEQAPSGRHEVVLLWMSATALSADASGAILRLVQRGYPRDLATLVDVRAGQILTGDRPRLHRYDGWLEAAVVHIARILEDGLATA